MSAGSAPPGAGSSFGAGLERFVRALAIAGGMLLVGVMGMTVASVIGRQFFGAPIPGDYELTELACGIAVFAFFPYCQLTNANVVVDFFTSRLHARHRAVLDAVHSVVFSIMAGLITWRLLVGGMRKFQDGETTLFLEIPIHWAYIPVLFAAGLLTAVSFLVVHRRLRGMRS